MPNLPITTKFIPITLLEMLTNFLTRNLSQLRYHITFILVLTSEGLLQCFEVVVLPLDVGSWGSFLNKEEKWGVGGGRKYLESLKSWSSLFFLENLVNKI